MTVAIEPGWKFPINFDDDVEVTSKAEAIQKILIDADTNMCLQAAAILHAAQKLARALEMVEVGLTKVADAIEAIPVKE